MTYFGRNQLGDEIRIQAVCRNAADAVVFPDSAPQVDVWQGSTMVSSGLLMFPTERFIVPGLFVLPLKLANLASGFYNCVIRWQKSGFNGISFATFEIVDGGDSRGNCISMIYFQPPNAQFLVRQTDAGILLQGRNPQ